jgi:uncharacterized protein
MAARRVAICNLTRGTILADRAEWARSPWRRLIGLLGRTAFLSGEGLIFAPCTGLHTIGMRFPIDLVYLRRAEFGGSSAVVVQLQPNLRPCRVALARADLVLELPTGTIAATGTVVGDRMCIWPSLDYGWSVPVELARERNWWWQRRRASYVRICELKRDMHDTKHETCLDWCEGCWVRRVASHDVRRACEHLLAKPARPQ